MELVYMYIKKYINKFEEGFEIKNTGLNFSDKFECEFTEGNELIIKEKDIEYKNFYSENIKNINLLVGENGTGKTTILDLLGMQRDMRYDDHYKRNKQQKNLLKLQPYKEDTAEYFTAEYFIIYHLKDNKFIAEFTINYREKKDCWIKNLNIDSVEFKDMFYKIPIGFVIEYDFKKNTMEATSSHCFNGIDEMSATNEKKIAEIINIYYFSHQYSKRITAFKGFPRTRKKEDDTSYLIKRQKINLGIYEPNDYKTIYEMFSDKKFEEFQNIMNFNPRIILKENFNFNKRDFKYEQNLTPKDGKLYEEKFEKIIKLLEKNKRDNMGEKNSYLQDLIVRCILELIEEFMESIYRKFHKNAFIKNINESINIKDIIRKVYDDTKFYTLINENEVKNIQKEFEWLEQVIQYIFEEKQDLNESKIGYDEIDKYLCIGRYLIFRMEKNGNCIKKFQQSFEEIVDKICLIDEKHFIEKGIEFKYENKINEEIIELFEKLQYWTEEKNEDYNASVRFEFEIMYASDGEKIMVDIFSKFINVLKNEDRDLHLIIMDEPDQRLHPEWARQFLNLMSRGIDVLNKTAYSTSRRSLNVQFLISTHSPFLLSDIREKDIILLEKNKEEKKLKISESKFKTFGANIYDILRNDFFIKEYIGEFATKKIKKDLEVIGENKEYFCNNQKKEVKEKIEEEMSKAKYIIECIGEPVFKSIALKEYKRRAEWFKKINEEEKSLELKKIEERFLELNDKEKKIFLKGILDKIQGNGDVNDKN